MKSSTRHCMQFACASVCLWQKRKFLLFLFFFLSLSSLIFSQDKLPVTVSGVVKDSSGNGLSNATVMDKATKTATSTDATGKFIIKVAGEKSVLVITSIGYAPQEIRVGN